MLLTNKTFYQTTDMLLDKMISKIKGRPEMILDPSAGSGTIIGKFAGIHEPGWGSGHRYHPDNIFAMETDPDLQAMLRGKGIKLLDSDFLAYSGPDKFDLIIANPPFDHGDLHLLKAISIMYRGQIIFLLNAETIKNPYSNTRKELAKKLKELNAEIEFIPDAFKNAERPADVEVALVNIMIERRVEDDILAGMYDNSEAPRASLETNHEVSTKKTIAELVAEYNQIIKIGTETIIAYYRNYRKIGKYIGLNKERDKDYEYTFSKDQDTSLTRKMQVVLNQLLKDVRINFWRRTLDLPDVKKRLTEKKRDEFEDKIKTHSSMDFTENNIRQFILNLIGSYEQTLTEAVIEIFDLFTIRHCYSNGLYEDNIHYFNGWMGMSTQN